MKIEILQVKLNTATEYLFNNENWNTAIQQIKNTAVKTVLQSTNTVICIWNLAKQ